MLTMWFVTLKRISQY